MAGFSVNSTSITSLVAVSRLSGAMTAEDSAGLEDEFKKLREAGTLGLILEVSSLEGITSAGLGLILNLSRVLREDGGRLIMAAAGADLAELVAMLGLRDKLVLAATLDQAKKEMAALKPPA